MNDFDELMQRFLDKRATAEEIEELKKLIRKGNYDSNLQELVDRFMNSEIRKAEAGEHDSGLDIHGEELFNRILRQTGTKTVPMPVTTQTPPARRWLLAAAAIAAIIISLVWMVQTRNQEESELYSYSGKQFVQLPDGSTALMNEGSELSFMDPFEDGVRVVQLTKGEAYFDVVPDPSHPFTVSTGDVVTTVLGTAFNVKADPASGKVVVTVEKGKVEVGDKSRAFAQVAPDQQIAVNTATNDFTTKEVDAEEELAWKKEFIVIDRMPMEEAMALVGERFQVKIIITNPLLKKCEITATFLNGEGLDHVLSVITKITQSTYTFQKDGSITLDGGIEC